MSHAAAANDLQLYVSTYLRLLKDRDVDEEEVENTSLAAIRQHL